LVMSCHRVPSGSKSISREAKNTSFDVDNGVYLSLESGDGEGGGGFSDLSASGAADPELINASVECWVDNAVMMRGYASSAGRGGWVCSSGGSLEAVNMRMYSYSTPWGRGLDDNIMVLQWEHSRNNST